MLKKQRSETRPQTAENTHRMLHKCIHKYGPYNFGGTLKALVCLKDPKVCFSPLAQGQETKARRQKDICNETLWWKPHVWACLSLKKKKRKKRKTVMPDTFVWDMSYSVRLIKHIWVISSSMEKVNLKDLGAWNTHTHTLIHPHRHNTSALWHVTRSV